MEVVISNADSSLLLADISVVNEDDNWSFVYEIDILIYSHGFFCKIGVAFITH